jgi:hypothetical protein
MTFRLLVAARLHRRLLGSQIVGNGRAYGVGRFVTSGSPLVGRILGIEKGYGVFVGCLSGFARRYLADLATIQAAVL